MATYLLKKSYQLKDLKEVNFKDLWGYRGVFTTMFIFNKPAKILFFKEHINNLIKSLKFYNINQPNIKKKILEVIKINLNKKKKYNHLLRIAVDRKTISISLRKKINLKSKFNLNIVNYKRITPEIKNLNYKKILNYMTKINPAVSDIALSYNNKLLETATSNLLFISNNKIYSPINKFYKGITLKFFRKKIRSIIKKNIFIKSLYSFDEIILVGSGKGVVSINSIKKPHWRRKSCKNYRFLLKIYREAVTNCPRYNG